MMNLNIVSAVAKLLEVRGLVRIQIDEIKSIKRRRYLSARAGLPSICCAGLLRNMHSGSAESVDVKFFQARRVAEAFV